MPPSSSSSTSPELVVLDEPTSGLDPRGMKDVRELIRDLGRGGVTVFLSSHLLHEVQQVCTRAVIIDRGRVVVQGPVAKLRPEGLAVKVMTDDQAKAAETARAMFGARAVSEDDGYLVVQAGDDVPELVRRLVADDLAVRSVIPAADQGLEDYFLELTARGMRPPEQEPPGPAGQAALSPGGVARRHEAEPAEDAAPSAAAEASDDGVLPGEASPDDEQSARAETPAPGAEETTPASGPRVTIFVDRPGGAGQPETRVLRPAGAGDSSSPAGADEVSPPPPADFAARPADRAAPPSASPPAAPPVDREEPPVTQGPQPGPTYRAAPPSVSRGARSPAYGAMPVSVYRAAPGSPPSPSSGPQSFDGRRR